VRVASKLSSFLAELKRRKVYRVATVYVVVGAGIIGLCEAALPSDVWEGIQIPVGLVILIGFPIALVLAWAYEVKPEEPRGVEEAPAPALASSELEQRKSIVVLPFDNMSPDPGDAYFADGLTEEIITNLSHIRSLRVISRNSAMALKGSERSTRVIAEELDVQYVLEGSVRKSGNDVRITAQLIDAPGDAHLWAERYRGTFDDIFDIQERVSRSIADALEIELTAEEGHQIAERPIEDLGAYEYYLKATAAAYRISEEGMSEALRHFRLALDTIGDNALLHSGIAYIHYFLMNIGVEMEDNRARALEAVQKALALDPELPKARALLGWLTMFYRGTLEDVKEGARHLKKALASNPDEFQALWGLAAVYIFAGRTSDAYPLARRLRQIEPLDPLALWMLGGVYYNDARYDLALQEYRRLYEMDSGHPWWRAWYAWMLAYDGQVEAATTILEESREATPDDMHTKLAFMGIHGLRGDREAARSELTGEFREWCWQERAWSGCIASALALLGEKEESLTWLEHAVVCGNINYPLFSERDPWLENIRGEERFKALMLRARRDWETFEI
jgi:TolB-like protein/Flp pilus assembly protein TadD